MRVCQTLVLAALIAAMPLGGMAQTEQFSAPGGGGPNLLHGCEIEWLFSKPDSLTGEFEPWLGPKRVPNVAPGPIQSCFGYAPTWELIKDFQQRNRDLANILVGLGQEHSGIGS
jgi:hypothetical protein